MFKKSIPVLLAIFPVASSAHAATWKMDGPHSSIGFVVSHMIVAKVHGTFNEFDGKIQFDGADVENGSVEVTIKTASIDTENERRDNHLRSADFLDAERFPEMTFKSKKIVKQEGIKYSIIGDLTIRGITKEVTLDAEHNGTIMDPWGNERAGFSATCVINRQDFDVKWNQALETGDFLVGNDVTIIIETELVVTE